MIDIKCTCGAVVGQSSKEQDGYECEKCYEKRELYWAIKTGKNFLAETLSKAEKDKIKKQVEDDDKKPKDTSLRGQVIEALSLRFHREPKEIEILDALRRLTP